MGTGLGQGKNTHGLPMSHTSADINRYSQLSSLEACYFEAMTLEVDKYYGCWGPGICHYC